MKRTAIVVLGLAAVVAASARAQLPVTVHPDQQELLQSTNANLAANKKLVFDFWREVFQARNMEPAPRFMAETYIQHNPNVPTGRQAFVDFFGQFDREPVKPVIDNLVNMVAERDMVVLALRRELPDPQRPGETYTTTWFDMLRIEDGKIAEHWDYGTKSTAACLTPAALRRLDGEWERALLESDAGRLRMLMADDFVWVHNHASMVDTKASLLERAADSAVRATGNARSRTQSDVESRVVGSTGVVTGFTVVDRGPHPTRYHFMRTYVEMAGRCVLLANHTMEVPAGGR